MYSPDSLFLRPHSSAPVVGSRTDSDFKYSSSEGGGVGNSRSFAYDDLHQATSGFSSNNLLGEGGFGCVYKGTLADGRDVAVKQLKVGGGQGEREFRAEVEIISRVHHRHLVSLVGYCISDYQRLLVYDYVPNNTLHYHLHGKKYFMNSDENVYRILTFSVIILFISMQYYLVNAMPIFGLLNFFFCIGWLQ